MLVSLEDLRQLDEASLPGDGGGGGVVVVPDGQGGPGPGAVQQGAGEPLQAVGRAEVEQGGQLSRLPAPGPDLSADWEGEEREAVLGDVGHEVLGESLVQLVLAVGGDGESLAEELQRVTHRLQQTVELLGLGLALELSEAFGLAVNVEVQANCKRKIE